MAITIEPWSASDSFEDLAALLVRAAAPVFDYMSKKSVGVQTVVDRVANGECFVARERGAIIATALYRSPNRTVGCPWYNRMDVASVTQVAVDPNRQGRGLGSLLLSWIEEKARDDRAAELAVDAPEHADQLIQYYQSRGYRPVGFTQWEENPFRSLVLSKNLQVGRYIAA